MMTAKEYDFTAFEAVNDKLKEIFVGISSQPMFQTVSRFQHERPAAIRHWDMNDVRTLRSIEFGLSEPAAKEFVEQYRRTKLPPGWRFLS